MFQLINVCICELLIMIPYIVGLQKGHWSKIALMQWLRVRTIQLVLVGEFNYFFNEKKRRLVLFLIPILLVEFYKRNYWLQNFSCLVFLNFLGFWWNWTKIPQAVTYIYIHHTKPTLYWTMALFWVEISCICLRWEPQNSTNLNS